MQLFTTIHRDGFFIHGGKIYFYGGKIYFHGGKTDIHGGPLTKTSLIVESLHSFRRE